MADSGQPARSGTHHAVLAGFLGWTLDAFDFFIVVFLFDTLAHQFWGSKVSPAPVGMAPDVLDRGTASAARAVYPYKSAGVGSVEAASRCKHRTGSARRCRRVEALYVSCRAYDVHDVPLARNPGSLSGFPERGAQDFRRDGGKYRDDL